MPILSTCWACYTVSNASAFCCGHSGKNGLVETVGWIKNYHWVASVSISIICISRVNVWSLIRGWIVVISICTRQAILIRQIKCALKSIVGCLRCSNIFCAVKRYISTICYKCFSKCGLVWIKSESIAGSCSTLTGCCAGSSDSTI